MSSPAARTLLLFAVLFASCGEEALLSDDPTLPPAPRSFRMLGCDLGLRVEFAGDLDPSTVTAQTLLVERAIGTVAYDPAGRAVTFVPIEPFASGELYTAVLTDEISSATGVRLQQPVRWQFACTDRSPPLVLERTPMGEGHSPYVRPSLRFSEPLDEATLTPENVGIDGVPVWIDWDVTRRTLTLVPVEPLHPGRSWTVRVSSKVRDRAGNALGADVSWSFRTRAPTSDWTVKLSSPPIPAATACDAVIELRLAPHVSFDEEVLSLGNPVILDGAPETRAEWDPSSGVLRVIPGTPLRPGWVYPLLATSLLRDEDEVAFFDDRTELARLQVVPDCDQPTVAEVAHAWSDVKCEGGLDVYFTHPMDPESVAEALSLRDLMEGGFDPAKSPIVPAGVKLDDSGRVATIFPEGRLLDGGVYWIALGAGARTADGIALERTSGWEVRASCP